MNVERFLYQVKQNLPQHEGVITWLEDSAVKVGYGDTGSFEIRYPGGVCYNAATEKTDEFYKLVEEAEKVFDSGAVGCTEYGNANYRSVKQY